MSLLVPILRAAHCRSTHHFFAIDALERMGTERGRRLADLLLKHYARYLKGSKDPDNTFKDFQNHVLHIGDQNWGGAPQACQKWLDQSMEHLSQGRWSEAAYACGVLSHYFTDPIMPLHTGQTEREAVVHRPMEWSICKAYEEIYAQCQFNQAPHQLKLSSSSDWISQAVTASAAIAHTHYARLIEIYNLARGTVDPPRGLTKEARQILGQLFDLALGGWASILTRIATDLRTPVPDCSLTMATLVAGIDVPRAFIVRKFTDAAERQAVKRIFDEFTETGALVDNLPAEVKVVQKAKAQGTVPILDPSSIPDRHDRPKQAVGSSPPDQLLPAVSNRIDRQAKESQRRTAETSVAAQAAFAAQAAETAGEEEFEATEEASSTNERPVFDRAEPTYPSRELATSPSPAPAPPQNLESPSTLPSPTLSFDSALVDAPSIGPKTAKRFAAIGIETIEQFLEADSSEMASALDTTWIKPELIEDWKDQAQLVCEVPALCGYKAQLLVAVDCRRTGELADASAAELYQSIEEFCQTKEAERILRSSSPPTREEIGRWIASAREVMATVDE